MKKNPPPKSPPKQPPEVTPADLEHEPDPPFPFDQMEASLLAGFAPSDENPLTVTSLRRLFQWLVVDAHKRKLLCAPFAECVEKACEFHVTSQDLISAVAFRDKIKASGTPTPNMDETINALLAQCREQRLWAVEHIKLMRELRPPGVALS